MAEAETNILGFDVDLSEADAADKGLLRGVDQTQMMLFSVAETMGSLLGVDWLADFGTDGVQRNLDEIASNPAEVQTWDDVDGLVTGFTYVVERLAEVVPQFAAMIAGGGLVGAGVKGAGLAATRLAGSNVPALARIAQVAKNGNKLQKAAMGKALKRKTGFKPFDNMLERAGQLSAVEKGVAAGTLATAGGMNAGESRLSQLAEGIDNPSAALATGAIKGLLDVALVGRAASIATKAGVPTATVINKAGALAMEVAKSVGLESGTEAAQTVIDFMAIEAQKPEFDFFSEDNWKELREAAIIGGLAGGSVGGVTGAIQLKRAVRDANDNITSDENAVNADPDALIDEVPDQSSLAPVVPVVVPEPVAEEELVEEENGQRFLFPMPAGQATIDAQFDALQDDSSSKDTMVLTPDESLPTGVRLGGEGVVTAYGDQLPGIRHYAAKDPLGFDYDVITRSIQDAQFLEEKGKGGVPTLSTEDFGRLMGRPEGTLGMDGTIITARDAAGNSVTDLMSGPDTLARDFETVEAQTPDGGSTELRTTIDTLEERTAELEAEALAATTQSQLQAHADVQEYLNPDDDTTVYDADEDVIPVTEAERRILPKYNNDGEGFDYKAQAIRKLKELERNLPDMNLHRDVEPFNGKWFVTQVENPSGIRVETPIRVSEKGVPLTTDSAAVPLGRKVTSKDTPETRSQTQTIRDWFTKVTQDKSKHKTKDEDGKPVIRTVGDLRALRASNEQDPIVKRRIEDTVITVIDPDGNRQRITTPDITDLGTSLTFSEAEGSETIGAAEAASNAFVTGLRELAIAGYDVSDAFVIKDNGETGVRGQLVTKLKSFRADPELKQRITYRQGASQTTPRRNKDAKVGLTDFNEILSYNERTKLIDELDAIRRKIDTPAVQDPKDLRALERQARSITNRLKADDRAGETVGVSTTNEISEQQNYAEDFNLSNKNTPREDLKGGSQRTPRRDLVLDQLGKREVVSKREKATKAHIEKTNAKLSADRRVRSAGASVTQAEVDFVAFAFNEMGIKAPGVTIADTNTTAENSDEFLEFIKKAPATAREIKRRFRDDAELMALTVNGPDGILIVLRAIEGNNAKALRTLFLGHEVGHHVLDSIISENVTPEMRKRLQKLFDKDRKDNDVEAWKGKDGFKEWFADKVAARARNMTQKPENLVDTLFLRSAETLRKLWNAMKGKLPERFKVNKSFGSVVTEMRHAGAFSGRNLYMEEVGDIQAIHFDLAPIADYVTAENLKTQSKALYQKLKDNGPERLLYYLGWSSAYINELSPALGRLIDQKPGTVGSNIIPDITADGTRTLRGGKAFQQGKRASQHRWTAKIQKLNREFTEQEIADGFTELATEASVLENPYAIKMRELLKEFFTTYLKPAMPTLQERANYFRRDWQTMEIANRINEWYALLEQHGYSQREIRSISESLAHDERLMPNPDTVDDASAMIQSWEMETKLKNPALIKDAVELGFLNPDPEATILKYFNNAINTAEKNRVAGKWVDIPTPDPMTNSLQLFDAPLNKTWDSMGRINQLINRNVREDQQAAARDAVFKTFHPTGLDPNNPLHQFLGETRAFFSWMTLAMSGIASIPEAGTLFVRMKGQMGLREYTKVLRKTLKDIRNDGELKALAEDLGTFRTFLSSSMSGDLLTNGATGRYGFFQKNLPKIFKYNGNDALVNFLRVAATGGSKIFITRLAKNIENNTDVTASRDMLAELGIKDHNIVLRWEAAGFPAQTYQMSSQLAEDTRIVSAAMVQFIDEAIMAPTTSDRPLWTNSVFGQMVIHLKSFAYKYQKTVLNGMYQEMKNQRRRGTINEHMGTVLAFTFVLMALAGLSDELRQRIASLGQKGTLAKNNYDPSKVFLRWFDKAGFFANPYHDFYTDPGFESAVYTAGPVFDWVHGLLTDNYGPNTGAIKALRTIPVLSQLPGLRRELVNAFE